MYIKEQLQLLKRVSGLTQEVLAKRLGVSFVTFNAWIRGRSQPRSSAIKRILEVLQEYGITVVAEDPLKSFKQGLSSKASHKRSTIATILGSPDIRDEYILALTYHSNVIEGSTLTKGETAAVLFDEAVLRNRTLREQIEAKNHKAAIEYLFRNVKPRSVLHEDFVLRLHGILMNGIQPDAGQYRRDAVRIVGANVPTANPASISKRMAGLIKNLNLTHKDVIGQAAKTHAEFEQIHPFTDGNGRVGRLILNAMLLQKHYAPAVITQQRKRDYLRYLNRAQMKGNFQALELFIVESVLIGWAILERRRGT